MKNLSHQAHIILVVWSVTLNSIGSALTCLGRRSARTRLRPSGIGIIKYVQGQREDWWSSCSCNPGNIFTLKPRFARCGTGARLLGRRGWVVRCYLKHVCYSTILCVPNIFFIVRSGSALSSAQLRMSIDGRWLHWCRSNKVSVAVPLMTRILHRCKLYNLYIFFIVHVDEIRFSITRTHLARDIEIN